ncbi:MAG: hypothetical protein QW543_02860 [Sulfolobales archaeon]
MGLVLSSSYCFKYGSRVYIFILSAAGWILGYVIEGPNFSLPQSSLTWIYVIPLMVVLMLTLLNYPTSITQLYISTLLGYSLATNYYQGLSAVVRIASSWVLSFVVGLTVSAFLRKSLVRMLQSVSVIKVLLWVRVLSLTYVFMLSYVLGGNLLGSVASLLGIVNSAKSILLISTSIVASVYVSLRSGISLGFTKILFPTRYLTSLIPYTVSLVLTQVANRLGVPIVISLVMFSSMIGVGLASEFKVFHRRRIIMYVLTSYIGPFILSLLLSYGLTNIYMTNLKKLLTHSLSTLENTAMMDTSIGSPNGWVTVS